MTPEVWIIVAVAAYWCYFIAIFEAFKPKPREGRDWFYGPVSVGWVQVLPEPEAENEQS